MVIYSSRSIEQSNTDVVRELLASGRIMRVYLDELGEIDRLPIGVGLMVLTTIRQADASRTRVKRQRSLQEVSSNVLVEIEL